MNGKRKHIYIKGTIDSIHSQHTINSSSIKNIVNSSSICTSLYTRRVDNNWGGFITRRVDNQISNSHNIKKYFGEE